MVGRKNSHLKLSINFKNHNYLLIGSCTTWPCCKVDGLAIITVAAELTVVVPVALVTTYLDN